MARWELGLTTYFGDDVPNMPPYAFIENDRLTCDPVDVNGRDLMKQQTMKGGYIHGVGPGEKGWQLDEVMPAITAKAVETIQTQSKTPEPFFLMFGTTSPHSPIVPQEEFQGRQRRRDPMAIILFRPMTRSGRLWRH